MSDNAQEVESRGRAGYEPPVLVKVGNVRELLAGEAGTVPDADPLAIDNQSGG